MRLVAAGSGEAVGDAPDRRVEILSDADDLHATWTRFGPYRDGADLHIHHHHTDLFYVLEGVLTARLGPEGTRHEVPAGALVRIPPLVIHGFRNGEDGELRYLNLHAPGRGFADFMRGLRDGRRVEFDQHDPPGDGGRSPDAVEVTDGLGVLAAADDISVRAIAGAEDLEPGALASLYVIEGDVEVGGARLAGGGWAQVPAGEGATVRGWARYLEIRTPGATGGG